MSRVVLWSSFAGVALTLTSFPARPGEGARALITGVVLLLGLLGIVVNRAQARAQARGVAIAVLLFGIAALPHLWSGDLRILAPLALCAAVVAIVLAPQRELRGLADDVVLLLAGYLALNLLAGLWGLRFPGQSSPFYLINGRELLGLDQLQGIAAHPNVLGGIAALGVVSAAALWQVGRLTARRALMLATLSILTLVWAQSRTAAIAVVVGLLAVALVRLVHRRAVLVALVSGLCCAAVLGPLALGALGLASFNGRAFAWSVGWDDWRESPWLGQGLDYYQRAELRQEFPGARWLPGHGHNQVVQELTQGGVLAAVALVLACALLVLALATMSRRAAMVCAPIAVLAATLAGTEIPLGQWKFVGSYVLVLPLTAVLVTGSRLED